MTVRNNTAERISIMGQGSIWKLLLRFSGPAIISMMVTSSYNIVDTIFVGRLGPQALAALALAFPLMMIFMSISIGTGTGAASLISRRFGAGDPEGAGRTAGVAIGFSIILGALLTAICLPNLDLLLRLFGATDSILSLSRSYMSILIAFAVLAFLPVTIGNIVRAEGNPVFASTIQIISAVINIVLDPFLIFGLGPFPEMGVAGAAVATVIARGFSTIVFIIYFASGRTSYRFRAVYFLPDFKILAEIYRVGIASIARMGTGSLIMVLVNRTAISFGVIPLAVLGVLHRAVSFIFMPSIGLGQGMLPLVGFNFGARQIERVGEVVIKAALASFIWGTLCWILVMLFPAQIISIFNNEPDFLTIGGTALRVFGLAFFAVGVQMTLGSFFQGIGKGLPSLIMATARQVIFLLPCLYILPPLFGITGLWATFPVADGLSIVLTLIWTGIQFRKLDIPFRLRYS